MNCHDAHRLLIDRLDQPLPAPQATALDAHLAACPACRATGNRMRQAAAALRRLDHDAPAVRVDVGRVYRRATCLAERARRRWRAAAAASLLTAALVLLTVGLGLRAEVHPTHVTVGWGPPPVVRPPEPPEPIFPEPAPLADPWPALEQQRRRMAGMDDLLNLTAREVLALDSRHADELAALRRRIEEMQAQNDLRWRLIAVELLSRDRQVAQADGP